MWHSKEVLSSQTFPMEYIPDSMAARKYYKQNFPEIAQTKNIVWLLTLVKIDFCLIVLMPTVRKLDKCKFDTI